ncbi:S24 family peptidase [Vibrio sinaloensis]|nr:S24 family peptidase [Vibrio sinaloensis]
MFNVAIDVLLDDGAPIQMLREQVEVPFFYPGMNQLKDISDKNREIREIFLIDKSFVDRPESTIALRVSGDSMTPVFSDNAIVFFLDTTRNVVSDGKVYVIIHEQLVRIKVLEKHPRGVSIKKSYNSNYPPEDVFTRE